ncbi:DUF2235 domain-containing protein [Neisseriaceae bacterium JH1-16]|nr:DUF2235 domain-containing protein [Neisseriaceae bacterium JH1-16]
MGKNILFCADGTWNGPGEGDNTDSIPDPTNVLKLFLRLSGQDSLYGYRLASEQEREEKSGDGTPLQIAKYLHGVGDSNNLLVKALGGAFGSGLITRIVRGYTFISRNYLSGDRIFIIGFSRGAYTARALAGLISSQGLIDPQSIDLSDPNQAYQAGTATWYLYRKEALGNNQNWLDKLENIVTYLPSFITRPAASIELIKNVPIQVVAVWETVGALGIPQYAGNDTRIDAFKFADTKLSTMVQESFQAIAIDEQRVDFTPTLWDPDPRVTQVLFCGAHADVGGGYPAMNNESGLSDITLEWMINTLLAKGVHFMPTPNAPDPLGVAHQPWTLPPWTLPGILINPRSFATGLSLSRTVLARCTGGKVLAAPGDSPADYRPHNLENYLSIGTTCQALDNTKLY